MLCTCSPTGAYHRQYHQRRLRLAAKHVAELGHLIKYLIEADTDKINKHEIYYRAHTRGSGTAGGSNKGRLSDRRINDPLATEFFNQAFVLTERATKGVVFSVAPSTTGHVLSHKEYVGICAHLCSNSFSENLANSFDGHNTVLVSFVNIFIEFSRHWVGR